MVLALPTNSVESFPDTSELFCNTLFKPLRCKPPLACNSTTSASQHTQQQQHLENVIFVKEIFTTFYYTPVTTE